MGTYTKLLQLDKKQVMVEGVRYSKWFPHGIKKEDMISRTVKDTVNAF